MRRKTATPLVNTEDIAVFLRILCQYYIYYKHYHFPFFILPITRTKTNIIIKKDNDSQIGDKTHNQLIDITLKAFKIISISVSVDTNPKPPFLALLLFLSSIFQLLIVNRLIYLLQFYFDISCSFSSLYIFSYNSK